MTLTAERSMSQLLAEGRARLTAAGIGTAALDAELLLAEASGMTREALLLAGRQPVAAEAQATYRGLIARRAAREPVARILGRREFWSLPFDVSEHTLVPRPESETLVEAALARLRPADRPWRLLDLGTGTGCLLLSLLAERPAATGLGTDVSANALATARGNARRVGLADRAAFAEGDWFAAVPEGERFDLVVSNPPYIPSAEIATLMPEVARFEPQPALDGGADGLAAYRAIIAGVPAVLRAGGWLLLEVGDGQAKSVRDLCSLAGLHSIAVETDLAGIERVVCGRRPGF